jgi:hypothetical protein
MFLPILHNIGLYIYTIKYKSGIKIPGFLRNISKKKLKTFSKRKKNMFRCIRPNSKKNLSIFSSKKIAYLSCFANKKWIS